MVSADPAPSKSDVLRVLVVEGGPSNTGSLAGELSRLKRKCAVRPVQSSGEFDAQLAEFHPDIILADYDAAEFGALPALMRLQAAEVDIPLIIVAGAHSDEVVIECLQRGAEDYVPKSGLARLPNAIGKALQRREAECKRRAVEEALRQSEEVHRLIAENVRDLICLLDLDGRFVYACPAFQSVLGFAPAELVGRSSFDLACPEDRALLKQLFEEAQFLRASRVADVRYVTSRGQILVFESAVSFAFDANGKPQRAVMVSRDISERKRSEMEIERLAAFPRNHPNPVLAFAPDGALIYYNDAAQTLAVALKREHPKDILPLNVAAVVRMCLATGQRTLRLQNTVAGHTVSWSFYPVQEGQVVHCYAEDITERLDLETKLRQSQKMESVGQLAAGVAHDFNNILTVIQGHSGLLLGSAQLNPGGSDSVKQIAVAAERAANLTRQLLMFSRKQLAQRQLIDLNNIIKDAGRMLRVLVGESIQIHFDCPPSLPAVYADPGMIQQVLINLAANARDAMPKGGQLAVHTESVQVEEAHAQQVPEARTGRFVCLSVSDSGTGMDAGTLERVFEPFFTTKAPGHGTGLGLATVYGIVKQHQGWVEVNSEIGRGTCFRIYLPAASKSMESDTDFLTGPVRGGDETILVVEDEPALRELVLEILQQYGYHTIEAASGVQALRIWADHKEEIDLVLTDVMMPEGVSGRDLTDRILAENPKMKLIYTSGYPMDVLGRDFSEKTTMRFLQKPYHPQTLAKTVRDCLDSNDESNSSAA